MKKSTKTEKPTSKPDFSIDAIKVYEEVIARKKEKLREAAKAIFEVNDKTTEEEFCELESLITRASKFNVHYHCVQLMSADPFFCKLSQRIPKIPSFMIPTAALSWHKNEYRILYNPFFMASLDDNECNFVLKHEFYHLIFGHLTSRVRDHKQLWNIATDLAINSLLYDAKHGAIIEKDVSTDSKAGNVIRDMALLPGRIPVKNKNTKIDATSKDKITKEQEDNEKLTKYIATFPQLKPSEWYYDVLKKFCEENAIPLEQQECQACAAGKGKGDGQGQCDGKGKGDGQGPPHTCGGVGGVNPLDDHTGWKEISEAEREMAEATAKKMVGEAVRESSQSNSWGSVPASMQAYLNERYSNQVNWRALLKQFNGRARGMTRVQSIKHINRRYPYVHPGIKRGYTANVWYFVDQSGSVDDVSLELLFGELNSSSKIADVRVYPFDHEVDADNMVQWRKGAKMRPKRTRCGGTSFQAVVDFLNEHKGECDGALILSDGECSMPTPAPCKFGYIIVPGRKLLFTQRPNEIHIQMKNDSDKPVNW